MYEMKSHIVAWVQRPEDLRVHSLRSQGTLNLGQNCLLDSCYQVLQARDLPYGITLGKQNVLRMLR